MSLVDYLPRALHMLRCNNDFLLLGLLMQVFVGSYAGRYNMLMLEARILLTTRPPHRAGEGEALDFIDEREIGSRPPQQKDKRFVDRCHNHRHVELRTHKHGPL
jgi:hypothetical protein